MIEWTTDPDVRRRALVGLNKGEAHHALKRAINFHQRGELRDRTGEGQHYRVAGLNLLAAIIIYWNTLKLGNAVFARGQAGLDCVPGRTGPGWCRSRSSPGSGGAVCRRRSSMCCWGRRRRRQRAHAVRSECGRSTESAGSTQRTMPSEVVAHRHVRGEEASFSETDAVPAWRQMAARPGSTTGRSPRVAHLGGGHRRPPRGTAHARRHLQPAGLRWRP